VICDDVRRGPSGRGAERVIQRFERGWHVNALLGADELRSLAGEAGFEHGSTQDLTTCLELRRARDRVVGGAAAVLGGLPPVARRFGHLVGGSALQMGLARGWIGYDLMLFTRG
jgi:hypothetical protein